jgi:putative membrane protein
MMIPLSSLPAVNASLNGASAAFLVAGFLFIRRGKILPHRICMITAFLCSTAFLAFYLYFHLHAGIIRFGGQGWIRPVYFTLLTSHTILAVVIVPLVLITLTRALRERFDRHRAIARWTLPLWLYVSVTGVVVYLMLYEVAFNRSGRRLPSHSGRRDGETGRGRTVHLGGLQFLPSGRGLCALRSPPGPPRGSGRADFPSSGARPSTGTSPPC